MKKMYYANFIYKGGIEVTGFFCSEDCDKVAEYAKGVVEYMRRTQLETPEGFDIRSLFVL